MKMGSLFKGFEHNVRLLAFSFVAYFSIWFLANWPAVSQPWFFLDDFNYGLRSSFLDLFDSGLILGRPIFGLWLGAFLIDQDPHQMYLNVIIRLIQGVFHCLATSFAAVLIWNQARHWTAFLFVLSFLLWPFNGEAVLWRSAGQYPIGALLGVLGVYLINYDDEFVSISNIFGCIILIAGMLTNQLSATSGLTVWTFMLFLNVVKPRKDAFGPKVIYKTFLIAFGYVIGGLLSYAIAYKYNVYTNYRAGFTTEVTNKILYLIKLSYMSILSAYYPPWLLSIIILSLTATTFAIAVKVLRDLRSVKEIFILVVLSSFLIVSPFFSLLIVSEINYSWRVMYLAPFIMTYSFIILGQILVHNRLLILILVLVFCVIQIGFIRISWSNSSEYVELFKNDIRILKNIEDDFIKENYQGKSIVIITSEDYFRTKNPYDLHYMQADSKVTAFDRHWVADSFVRRFSTLEPNNSEEARIECISNCKSMIDGKSFELFKMKDNNAICLCPP